MKSRNEKGFTLLEVLLAMAIFTFGALAIAHLQGVIAKGNSDARALGEATRIARQMAEELSLLRSLYAPANGGVCQGDDFRLSNKDQNIISLATLDPDAVESGESDPYCPMTTQVDDLGQTEAIITDLSISDLDVARYHADRCLRPSSSAECAPVDALMNFGTTQARYWVVWNLRAGYPFFGVAGTDKQRMTTARIHVYWRGMDGRRHMVTVETLLTAKDMRYYY